MAGEMKRAITRLNDRREALVGKAAAEIDDQTQLRLLSGFDLDPDEFLEMRELATAALKATHPDKGGDPEDFRAVQAVREQA